MVALKFMKGINKMENSKAKDVMLKCFDKLCSDYSYQNGEKIDMEDALYTAAQALELQIPKKVIYGYDDQDPILCPHCSHEISWMDSYDKGIDKYCSECGQRLDWTN